MSRLIITNRPGGGFMLVQRRDDKGDRHMDEELFDSGSADQCLTRMRQEIRKKKTRRGQPPLLIKT